MPHVTSLATITKCKGTCKGVAIRTCCFTSYDKPGRIA
uniref:Uncharacterized protein n=1 Tax=Arundo donax TaxID=35708 RepID=A0A0A9B0X5_ARUDO